MTADRILAIAGILAAPVLLILGSVTVPESVLGSFNREATPAAELRVVGTPPRAEREYKLELRCAKGSKFAAADGLAGMRDQVHSVLKKSLAQGFWQVPSLTGNAYYMAREPMTLVGRDVYFDVAQHVLYDHAISYRLRHRFKTLRKLIGHEADAFDPRCFPYRCELQVKVGRTEQEAGYSQVEEARFEFRIESEPFSQQNPPPPPPWHPRVYVPFAQRGIWKNEITTPGHALTRWLRQKGASLPVKLRPELVLVTQRQRMHLDMKTEFGSGPNPDQAFIISIDHCYVYDARPYMAYIERTLYGDAQRPSYLATFDEVEIEFERNVSTVLDERIRKTSDPKLNSLHSAFRQDQESIRRLVETAFQEQDVVVAGASRSKYQKAYQLKQQAQRKDSWTDRFSRSD